MSETTALFALIDALLAKFRTDPILTGAGVHVYDGPPTTDVADELLLFVAGDPNDPLSQSDHVSFSQTWAEAGARSKYEDLTVACELWVRSGDTDMATRRTKTAQLLAAIESALRTDFALSIGRLLWAHLSAGQLRQMQTKQGAMVALAFTVTARARLGP